jgi:hypothetical protein
MEAIARRKTVYLLAALLLTSCSQGGSSEGAYRKTIKAADESAAIQLLRTIAAAQAQSKATRGSYGDFNNLVQAGFLDQRFAATSPELNGYRFTMRATESEFSVTADPQTSPGETTVGNRHFYLDSGDNAIHVNPTKTATKADPAL